MATDEVIKRQLFKSININIWIRKVLKDLKLFDCDDPATREKNENEDQEEWDKKNLKAMKYIYEYIKPAILPYVKEEKTAFELLKRIKSLHLNEATDEQIYLRNKLDRIKLKDLNHASSFFLMFESIVRDIEKTGGTVDEEEKLNFMLKAIPDSLSKITFLVNSLNESNKNYEFVKNLIITIAALNTKSYNSESKKTNTFRAEQKKNEHYFKPRQIEIFSNDYKKPSPKGNGCESGMYLREDVRHPQKTLQVLQPHQMLHQIEQQMQPQNQMEHQMDQHMQPQVQLLPQTQYEMQPQMQNQIQQQQKPKMKVRLQLLPQMQQQKEQQMESQMQHQIQYQIQPQMQNQMQQQMQPQVQLGLQLLPQMQKQHQMQHQIEQQMQPQMQHQMEQQLQYQIQYQMQNQRGQQMQYQMQPQMQNQMQQQMQHQVQMQPQVILQPQMQPQMQHPMEQQLQQQQQQNLQLLLLQIQDFGGKDEGRGRGRLSQQSNATEQYSIKYSENGSDQIRAGLIITEVEQND